MEPREAPMTTRARTASKSSRASKPVDRTTTITADAVKKATGFAWPHWFAVLDGLGEGVGHTERARHLREAHGLAPWWSQMVTVQYERARGHRVPNQRADGVFEVNVERTVA